MAKAKFYQKGNALDFANETGAKIEANTVLVRGGRVVIVGTELAAGEKGSVITEGVFELPKSVSSEIAEGAAVYFDGTGITTVASGNTAAGYAAYKAAASDSVVYVKLLG